MDTSIDDNKEEKEYVLMEFEDGWLPNSTTRFTVTGLDTMNPSLVFEDGTKMVGRYEETIGTCILFAENEEGRIKIDDETKTQKKELGAEPNPLFVRTFSKDEQSKPQDIQPVCAVHKRLKFRVVQTEMPINKIT
ncbi:hypothetical protein KP509_21G027400 [Ceratopteris richardii]|uniref:Transcription factor TFIIIC triple barrel domain-containing protein n=1 Tax=Ceratopteris richardii TaxID=49495 RepID=A0A8T2SBF0_CERRI|nr:hypothetical protein KP509_21G027400 [Ceratopteris richardii]KAH7314923.1 hypothetical protein KP509_21G027400 [Ceratopteris richardii]